MKKELGRIGAIVLIFALSCAWGCAVPGGAGKSPRLEAEIQEGGSSNAPAVSGRATRTVNVTDVQVRDEVDETVIRITGNVPFVNYHLERLGENRFVLELDEVPGVPGLPLPGNSSRVELSYSENAPKGGIQVLGNLHQPLQGHMLTNLDNTLILTLTFNPASVPAPEPRLRPREQAGGQRFARVPARGPEERYLPVPAPPAITANADGQGVSAGQTDRPQVGSLRKQYTGKPISLDLMDADLRNVLRLLSDITATNIVIEPDVSGRVTLKVEQVPWDQVLDMVLAMNGLGKEQVGNVIRIARQDKLKQEWSRQAEEIRAKQELLEAAKDMGELSTVYLTVNYAQPAEIAAKIAENKSERGKVSIDERTSLIIYSDYPARIETARQLLARLDRATPQVLIEARIVTLNSDTSRTLGARLGLRSTTPPNRTETQDFQLNALSTVVADVAIAQVVGKSLLSLDLELSALETASELRIMAAPRVLTMDNVKATISQGTQIPYLAPTTQASNVLTTEFKDAVLELSVIPHITPDRKVRLEIEAKQDEPSTTLVVGLVPGIDTRKISTELLVDDGNIVVIGGVIRNADTSTVLKTPGLSDVPLLGWMFRSKEVRILKQELLIFISPRIVEASGPPRGTRFPALHDGRIF